MRRRRKFLKPLQTNWENLGILGPLAREARGKFWEFLPCKTAFLMNFGYVWSKNFETPLGQIGEFPRIFETPPTQIGLWAKIFETPPEELVAGGDLKGGGLITIAWYNASKDANFFACSAFIKENTFLLLIMSDISRRFFE